MQTYTGMVSSDWSQCLSPSGPYDAFIYHYPQIEGDLKEIFRRYTANEISLGQAIAGVKQLLPEPLSQSQMDAYLDAEFDIYTGVDALIQWCRSHRVLFMINTTGLMGYFQRALHKSLLPPLDALSAHPMLRFEPGKQDPGVMAELFEIQDKAANTAAVAAKYRIPPENIVIMGDSGGDGPHFEWGAKAGATLTGSMTKPSLEQYCSSRGINIHHHIGKTYGIGDTIFLEEERRFDFSELIDVIRPTFGLGGYNPKAS